MKVSEKTLELNVGAELLYEIRMNWGFPRVYLRGLTQREEKQEGVDFFVQLSASARIFAFQFKAPHGPVEGPPYKYTLNHDQHKLLHNLALLGKNAVYYVLPFYVTTAKLEKDVPSLVKDTWVADIATMPAGPLFGGYKTRTFRCHPGKGEVNPEYQISPLSQLRPQRAVGVPARSFDEWNGSASAANLSSKNVATLG